MYKIIAIIALILLIASCDDEPSITKIDDKDDSDTIEVKNCNFDNFNIEYTYINTVDNQDNPVDIFENTIYNEAEENQRLLRIKITEERTIDSVENLLITNIHSACNSTGREFDLENCKFTDRTDFATTKVYCGNLDSYLLERITGNELYKSNKDTIIVYEEVKGWYHYFLSNKKNDDKVEPLPNIKIKSEEILVKDDTLKIPLNINFLKNDSTKCFVDGIEVEPVFYDFKNSYIIMPECNTGSGFFDMRKNVSFYSISKTDTIVSIDNILFFLKFGFNNVEINIENIFVYVYTTYSSWHPQNGSYSSTDSTILSQYVEKVERSTFEPYMHPIGVLFPLSQEIEGSFLKSITLKSVSGYYSSISYEFISKQISLNNYYLNLLPNKNDYNIVINDNEIIKKILHISQSMNYSDGNSSSTKRSKSMKLSNIIYTDSTYLSVKLIREK